jgi:hypothetical protein
VLRDVLEGVERLDSERLPPPDRLREALLHIAATTTYRGDDDDALAGAREWESQHGATIRQELAGHILALTEAEALLVPKSPCRRRLDLDERRRVIARIRKRWPSGTDDWNPEAALRDHPFVLRVESYWLTHEVRQEDFRRMVSSATHRPVWMLRGGDPQWSDEPVWSGDYEVSSDYCWPGVGHDLLWTPKNAEWMIFQERYHDTWFVGDWLVRQIKHLWPNWYQHIWTTMSYDTPPPKPGAFRHQSDLGCSHVRDDYVVPVWYRPPGWTPSATLLDAEAGDD